MSDANDMPAFPFIEPVESGDRSPRHSDESARRIFAGQEQLNIVPSKTATIAKPAAKAVSASPTAAKPAPPVVTVAKAVPAAVPAVATAKPAAVAPATAKAAPVAAKAAPAIEPEAKPAADSVKPPAYDPNMRQQTKMPGHMPGMHGRPQIAPRAMAAKENFVEGDYVVYPDARGGQGRADRDGGDRRA